MCKLFNEWTPQIKEYCMQNNLSFEKAEKMSKCWGKNDVILQYYDKNSKDKQLGLLNETPMPIVLKIEKIDGVLKFKQTEFTKQYLAM